MDKLKFLLIYELMINNPEEYTLPNQTDSHWSDKNDMNKSMLEPNE